MTVAREVTKEEVERLRKKRFIDAGTAETMTALGWRQATVLEGLLWCPTCSQPTVWRDTTGSPSHLWCSDAVAGVIA